jgi:DNA-binding IclR family transcriptional regulator
VHATALGKVLLAWNPVLSRHTRSEFDRFSARTITSPTELARSLVLVRSLGWAAETEEHQRGRASIAAPIRRSGGQVVAAIGIDGELDRLCEPSGRPRAALVAQVRHAAAAVSRDLATSRR